MAEKNEAEQIEEDLDDLLKKAMAQPGVAEAMRVYDAFQPYEQSGAVYSYMTTVATSANPSSR